MLDAAGGLEVSRTVVFDEPCRVRSFFEALIADNLDLGRPENVEIIFGPRVRCDTPGTFRTAIYCPVIDPDEKGGGEHLRQALAGQAVPERGPGDADRDRHQLPPRPCLQLPAAQPGRASGQGPRHQPAHTGSRARPEATVLASPAFERIAHPSTDADGRRTPALRFGDPRVTALAGALAATLTAATGITNKSLRALITGLLHAPYAPGQMTYDLRLLRLAGLIRRIEHTNTYALTPDGIKFAVFYTNFCNRLLRPLMAADQAQAPPELRQALDVISQHVDDDISRARLGKAA